MSLSIFSMNRARNSNNMTLARQFLDVNTKKYIEKNIVAFVKVNLDGPCSGTIKLNESTLTHYGLKYGFTYEIYLKLKSQLSINNTHTRLVLATVCKSY